MAKQMIKKTEWENADRVAVKGKAAPFAAKKRSVDKSKTVEEEVHTSKRGRVVKKRI